MKKNTDPLQPDTYYHIYNRGINGTRIFTKKENPAYFLEKYIKYITPVADTFAYVLMGNHFHFLIKTKSEAEVRSFYENRGVTSKVDVSNVGEVQNLADVKGKKYADFSGKPTHLLFSNQFAKFFNAYAQAFNKQEARTGSLFEEPFRRIEIDSEAYAAKVFPFGEDLDGATTTLLNMVLRRILGSMNFHLILFFFIKKLLLLKEKQYWTGLEE